MLPKDAKDLALVRMAQVVAAHELLLFIPVVLRLVCTKLRKNPASAAEVATVLKFLEFVG